MSWNNEEDDNELVRQYILRKQAEDEKLQKSQQDADTMRTVAGVTEGLGAMLGPSSGGVAKFGGWDSGGSGGSFQKAQKVAPNMESLRAQAANTEQRGKAAHKDNMDSFGQEQQLLDMSNKRKTAKAEEDRLNSVDSDEAVAYSEIFAKHFPQIDTSNMSVKEMKTLLDPVMKSAGLDLDKQRVQQAGAKADGKTPFKDEAALRREMGLNNSIKNFGLIDNQFSSYNSLKGTKGGPADEARIVMFQKLLDPTSVVRESEFARTTQGQSLLGRLEQYGKQMASGQKLTDDMKAQIDATMHAIYSGARASAENALGNYEMTIDDAGYKPERVLPAWALEHYNKGRMPAGAQQAPAPVQQQAPASISPEDQQAIEWAKQNPSDPRAQKILKLHPGA